MATRHDHYARAEALLYSAQAALEWAHKLQADSPGLVDAEVWDSVHRSARTLSVMATAHATLATAAMDPQDWDTTGRELHPFTPHPATEETPDA